MKRKNVIKWTLLWLGVVWVMFTNSTSATSDYMHYATVDGVDTITICDPNDSTKCITMQDKNLWASTNDITSTGSYGYHFQRWNNHWFEIGCQTNWCSDAVTNSATSTLATWSSDYNHVWYNWTIFIKWTSSSKYDYWSDNTPSNHNWLPGWENDTADNNYWYDEENNVALNVTGRQWPCQEWYHVPSIWEWNQVLEYWAEENEIELEDDGGLKYNYTTLDWLKFQEDFKIPFAGYRYNFVAKVYSMGYYAYLWSSSPLVGNVSARGFYLGPSEANANDSNNRAFAYSLRCFKDSYLEFPSAASQVAFWTGEVDGEPACSGEVLSWEVVSWDLLVCVEWLSDSKQYYTLSGWRDVEADARRNTWDVVTTGLSLQAVWTPNTDANENWIADEEESFVITRKDGEGNFVWSGEFEYGVSPEFGGTEPEKTGYTFNARDPAVENVTGDFTYFATWTVNEYSITFRDWSGVEADVVWTWEYGSETSGNVDFPAWTKTGYTLFWNTEIPSVVPAENTIITATWTVNQYTITFDTDWWTAIDSITADFGLEIIAPANPTKDGYTFAGWDVEIPTTMPAENITITARWTANPRPSSGWWGGGGSSLKKDNCPDGDHSDSYYDGTCGTIPSSWTEGEGSIDDDKDSSQAQNDGNVQDSSAKSDNSSDKPQNDKTWHNSADEFEFDTLKFNPYYSDEMNQAYQFAYHYWITTKNNIKDAAMNWELTRIAMAKMLSQYAINVLGKTPDITKQNKFNDVSENLDSQYDDWVTLAYQLWIMGINMPSNKFRPYDEVTRAEFTTALSRLLYNLPDWTDKYYSTHIYKLYNEWIITVTDPTMKELRGYVMLMLMRSAK